MEANDIIQALAVLWVVAVLCIAILQEEIDEILKTLKK